jgi:hypothetical protein
MKIIVTGSLGHISKPLTTRVSAKRTCGYSYQQQAWKDKRTLKHWAQLLPSAQWRMLIFYTATFKGADVVYVYGNTWASSFMDPNLDLMAIYQQDWS